MLLVKGQPFFYRETILHDRHCNINFEFSILIWQGQRPKLGPPLGKHILLLLRACILTHLLI